ncbi:hypothetical protein PR048_008548 [Dryococelus australis]|uniref:Uncharacterized protein n=1 Tax=Dryococelus australis TaxID=614101 RepID=A0ABQ9HXF2_9NEOP|nr:hypothetical protein PR048_008548 [Dryococelus australis]
MTTKQVEKRQLEQLVQDQVKELLSSKDIESVIETVSFNLEEMKKLREDLPKMQESLQEAKREHFLSQDELEQYQQPFNPLQNELQLPHVNTSDIDRSYHVGAKKECKPHPLIVKFTSYRWCNEVFHTKCFLEKSGVTIREDLMMECFALLNAAIAKYGLHNVWTASGRIVVKCGACRCQISRPEELKIAK